MATSKTKESKQGKYDSDSIETLAFPESIRKNPAMYLGGTDGYGLFVCLRELLDNAADEYLAGRNKSVGVSIDADGSYWVQDGGSGIPQGTKSHVVNVDGKKMISKMPTMQAVFGELHTSGKFRSEAYKVSIGAHGVGSKGTNATSDLFEVWTCYEDQWYGIKFKKGELVSPVAKAKAPISPLTGKRMVKGTLIHFKPDLTIFTAKSFPSSMLLEWSEVISYLNPGFQVVLKAKGKTKVFLSKEGPKDYIQHRLTQLKAEAEHDVFEFNNDLATVVVAFSNVDGFEIRGFTNGLSNSQGGKHVDSVANALYEAVQTYKLAKQEFTALDFRDGLLGLVNAKLHKAQFSSQDKAKLTDPRMDKDFRALVLEEAKAFFSKNKALAKRLCERSGRINELKNKFKASKAVATALNKVKKQGLPPNYAPPHKSVKVADRELLIVEGESACFTGDTKVRLATGESKSFLELINDAALGISHDAYGFVDGHFVKQKALVPRSTRQVTTLLHITLENGQQISCTEDHRFLLRDGSYKEARNLTQEDDIQSC